MLTNRRRFVSGASVSNVTTGTLLVASSRIAFCAAASFGLIAMPSTPAASSSCTCFVWSSTVGLHFTIVSSMLFWLAQSCAPCSSGPQNGSSVHVTSASFNRFGSLVRPYAKYTTAAAAISTTINAINGPELRDLGAGDGAGEDAAGMVGSDMGFLRRG